MSLSRIRNSVREFFIFPETPVVKKLPVIDKTPKDFEVGQVYKMYPAFASHVKNPYYVIIRNVCSWHIETEIPNQHSLIIKHGSFEWDYHMPRMEFVGTDSNSRQLLYNQKLQ